MIFSWAPQHLLIPDSEKSSMGRHLFCQTANRRQGIHLFPKRLVPSSQCLSELCPASAIVMSQSSSSYSLHLPASTFSQIVSWNSRALVQGGLVAGSKTPVLRRVPVSLKPDVKSAKRFSSGHPSSLPISRQEKPLALQNARNNRIHGCAEGRLLNFKAGCHLPPALDGFQAALHRCKRALDERQENSSQRVVRQCTGCIKRVLNE